MAKKLGITNKESLDGVIADIGDKINQVIDGVNEISSKIIFLNSAITTSVGSTIIKQTVDGIKCSVAETNDLSIKGSKMDSSFELSNPKELSNLSVNYNNIEVGQLTDEEMFKFNLGPYSKKRIPGSTSV